MNVTSTVATVKKQTVDKQGIAFMIMIRKASTLLTELNHH